MSQLYDTHCPVGRVMNVIGDRWSVMLMRDLLQNDGTRRFQDFLNSLDGLSPNTLSARLKLLEKNGVVERRMYADFPPRAEYQLTRKGWDLGPIVLAMKKWGNKYKSPVRA